MKSVSRGKAPPPPNEAQRWQVQRPVAESALDFAISFLGCRMGANKDPLDAKARSRLLDICRAVSIAESQHGTVGTYQPKRDPFQCGNPGDSWWKELTRQSGQGSRFVRGPGLSNLWANQVAAEAEKTTGFDPLASHSLLTTVTKGHQNTQFSPYHSYYWGVIYLIHRINANAGDPSYACGDLSRSRLIDGAVTYNGGGVANYKVRLENGLAEFGGLEQSVFSRTAEAEAESAAQYMTAILKEMGEANPTRLVRKVALKFDPENGRVTETSVEFGSAREL